MFENPFLAIVLYGYTATIPPMAIVALDDLKPLIFGKEEPSPPQIDHR